MALRAANSNEDALADVAHAPTRAASTLVSTCFWPRLQRSDRLSIPQLPLPSRPSIPAKPPSASMSPMSKLRRATPSLPPDDAFARVRQRSGRPASVRARRPRRVVPHDSPYVRLPRCLRCGQDRAHTPRQARHHRGQWGLAGNYRSSPRQSAPPVPEHAVHYGIGKRRNGLAGPSIRRSGFRGGGPASLRARPRRGSSNRKGAGRAPAPAIGNAARKSPANRRPKS